ncbi:hypothetical protein ABXT70_11280 [Candidatus Njordibacter sp. Uisw_039]|jgi:hypothetical protein|uniref:hypothetical protein n=1 Tax=Candidatus Njordibacter sp. Uisw_039 TaxID=3230972 RepID=UPI003A4B7F7C|tara:strand:- start:5637 stop:5942 length:306 start_codon:yes stop_codon:yes gene_type:complete
MARKPYVKAKALQGRGHLQSVATDGPHVEWLGMPEYYIHTLVIAEQEYAYFSANKALEFEVGAYVCFRARESKNGFYIEKRSLGIAIDPAEYMRQLESGNE